MSTMQGAGGTPATTTRLPEWLGRRAADLPEHPALIIGSTCWSFAALDRAAMALAAQLAAVGVGEDSRVGVLLRNGPHFVVAVHALIRLGAILVPINVRLSAAEQRWLLQDVAARHLLIDRPSAADRAMIAEDIPGLRIVQLDAPSDGNATVAVAGLNGAEPLYLVDGIGVQPSDLPAIPVRSHIDLAAVHCIMYTSGTTGRPKGAMLSYGNHWWSAAGSALNLGHLHDDRWLAPLPFFHIGGLAILLRSVIYGITVVLPDQPEASFDPLAINRAVRQQGVSIISVVSAQLQRMLDEPREPLSSATCTLRCVLLGGGPAPRPLLEECARRNIPVVQSYGLTETASQAATLSPTDAIRKLGSAGRPLLPTELRIKPEAGAGAAGVPQVGEILVRGATVSSGYIAGTHQKDAPPPALDAEGWLRTGDVGYLDDEGYLYVLDRRDDLIISGGENIYPAEVEAILLAYAGIAEAGVYGVPDERWGQRVMAAISLRPGATFDESAILDFCRERLASYKVPVALRPIASMPRNASGKLMRRILRDQAIAAPQEGLSN